MVIADINEVPGNLDRHASGSPSPDGKSKASIPVEKHGSPKGRATDSLADFAARTLVITCALNLNDVGSMLFDVGQVFSAAMLGCSVVLVAKQGRIGWSIPLVLVCASIAMYLSLGTLFFDPISSVAPAEKFQLTYGATIIILWGVASYVAGLEQPLAFRRFLQFVRNTFLIASASVWASPLLYQLYVNVAADAEQRMGGFFGNPNEAAYAALIAVALVLNVPYRRTILQALALALASGAVVLTFSKAGISLLIIIVALHLFLRANGIGKMALLILALVLMSFIQNSAVILRSAIDLQLVELSSSQQSRILAVGEILGGRIDEETTTRRSILWSLALDRSGETFPLGDGLGSYHHIVGGILENGVWQGSHNVFLMLLGESGPLPVLLLIGAIVGTGYGALRLPREQVEPMLLLTAILFASMMAGHTGLGVRYQNVTLGIVLGAIAASARANSRLQAQSFTRSQEAG